MTKTTTSVRRADGTVETTTRTDGDESLADRLPSGSAGFGFGGGFGSLGGAAQPRQLRY